MEGDRKIPALKLFMSQLDRARQPVDAAGVLGEGTSLVGLVLLGVDFTRVWLQVCTYVPAALPTYTSETP